MNQKAIINLFSVFHLNLAFSSIKEELRPEVISRCYWPLLQLVRKLDLPIGIEASAFTLETINSIDPAWILELRQLCSDGPAEFIGSGYAQLIGPLVPAKVNLANQHIGLSVYENLLGFRPQIVLVNEQAYSSGLVQIYRDVGYQAIIMEWDNPASSHPEWNTDWRFLPQRACAPDGSSLPVIWNLSIPFQKFQRYAHGELSLEDYLRFLDERVSNNTRTFALYGNDTEIFDFRPVRFQTEAILEKTSEWGRIDRLFKILIDAPQFALIPPSRVLTFLDTPDAGKHLHLESSMQPIPVKKQPKYNITRWALTGRDDLDINTRCWRIYKALTEKPNTSEDDWKTLCFLWSSDFRTHITNSRWENFLNSLKKIEYRLNLTTEKISPLISNKKKDIFKDFKIIHKDKIVEIETKSQKVRLNYQKGLTIEGLWNKNLSKLPLLVTLPHGYFDDINYGADFFSGHFVCEVPGQHKITDLVAVDPDISMIDEMLCVRGSIKNQLGLVIKEVRISPDKPELHLFYHFAWPHNPNGAMHLGHITLNPELFNKDKLFVKTHNGGLSPETFVLPGTPINHLQPISSLVSANQGLGITEGIIELGDDKNKILIEVDKCASAVTGHIYFEPIGNSFLYRLIFSAMEMDDTSQHFPEKTTFASRSIKIKITSTNEKY